MENVMSIRSVVCQIIMMFRSFWLVTYVTEAVLGVRVNFAATSLLAFAGTLPGESAGYLEQRYISGMGKQAHPVNGVKTRTGISYENGPQIFSAEVSR